MDERMNYDDAVKKGRELLRQRIEEHQRVINDRLRFGTYKYLPLIPPSESKPISDEDLQVVKEMVKNWPQDRRQALYTHLYEVWDCRIYGK